MASSQAEYLKMDNLSLFDQLKRCDLEIASIEAYLSVEENPDKFGALRGLMDWLVNRQMILEEIERNGK